MTKTKTLSPTLYKVFVALSLVLALYARQAEAVKLDCMIKPNAYIKLGSPVTGIVEKIFVDKGDRIVVGQPLIQLEASVEIARVKQAKFEASDFSKINNRKARLEFAKRSLARYEALKSNQTVSRMEVDKLDTEMTVAKTDLAEVTQDHQTAKLALQLAEAQLAIKTIRSPIDGLVVDRFSMVGESVNDEKVLMKLVQIEPLMIELIAPTDFFGLIQEDMQVDIHPERPQNQSYRAKVTQVDKVIDPASGSFVVRMAFLNPDPTIISGVNCSAHFAFEMDKP